MYYLHLCQLLQKVAVRHSSYYFEISCYKGSIFFFHHIFTFLTKPSWSSKFEAKRDPYPATHRRDIRCWGGGVELVRKSFIWFHNIFHLYISSPAIKGCKNNPAVPRIHTRMKTHRKIRSITMATYFQSSWICKKNWIASRYVN